MKTKTVKLLRCSLCGTLALLTFTSCSSLDKSPATTALFNGKNLDGWIYVSADPKVKMEDVWSVRDGMIVCQGTPMGLIYKPVDVADFKLTVEYRWTPGTKPGNSGIFSRINEPVTPLPHAIEVQLMNGSAGDVMGLQGMTVASGQPRSFEVKKHELAGDIAGVKKLTGLENPPGQWNRVEVLAKGASYTVWINGALANQVSGVEVASGGIGLQSEGGQVEFRKVRLASH